MSNADARGWGPGWPNCNSGAQAKASGGGISVNCRREIAPLVARALEETRAAGYILKQDQTGAFCCRPIGGTNTASNHSWGLAIDLNWNENPFTRDVNAHRTITSQVVDIWKRHGFTWGGDWSGKKDFMHMEFIGTVGDAARRVAELGQPQSPVPQPVNDGKHCQDPSGHPTLKIGSKGGAVNHLQYFLIKSGAKIPGDGDFGHMTDASLQSHQQWLHDTKDSTIVADGICGPKTWQAIHNWADGLLI